MLSDSDFAALIDAAVAAPSADNLPTWRISRKGTLLRVRQPGLSTMAATQRRLSLISLGCVAENLLVRAEQLGLSIEVDATKLEESSGVLLQVSGAMPPGNPLDAMISRRHSNRQFRYRGPKLRPDELRSMSAATSTLPGTWVQWLDAPDARRKAAGLAELAERQRFSTQALHEEMYGALRFELGWQATSPTGLPPGALGVHPVERAGFRMMAKWPVQRFMNLLGVHRLLALRAAAAPIRLAPNVCVIGAAGHSDHDVFTAGRLVQRIWLHATLLGRSSQVFAASPLYAMPGASAIDPELQRKLAAGWQELCPTGSPMMLMRMGMAPDPTTRTGRQPPSSMMEAADW